MIKRCSWGTCNSDSRYPDRLKGGISFKPFTKPKRNLERCKLWIKHPTLNSTSVFFKTTAEQNICMFAARVGLISEHLISAEKMIDKDVQIDEIMVDDGQKNLELLATVTESKELQEEYARLLLKMKDLKRCKIAANVPLRTSQFSYEGLKEADFQNYTAFGSCKIETWGLV